MGSAAARSAQAMRTCRARPRSAVSTGRCGGSVATGWAEAVAIPGAPGRSAALPNARPVPPSSARRARPAVARGAAGNGIPFMDMETFRSTMDEVAIRQENSRR
jgi:hypothetical protein